MITVLILGAAISPKRSYADASVSMNDGFVIEADRVEGVMGIPGIINGETSTQKNKLMLRLTFSKATIYGLTITKVLNTPNGPVTIHFKSTGPVELTNMAVDVTKIEFGGIYLPNKLGELGMKNVLLVAHKQTANEAILPALVASLEEQGVPVDTTSDSDENLTKQAEVFKKISGDSKDGKLKLPLDELNKVLQPNKEEGQKDKNSGNNPLDKINKILQPSKTGKNKDNSTVLEDKKTQSANNEQSSDKVDSKTSNIEENQNNQQSDNAQQTGENNSDEKNQTSDSAVDTTDSGNTKQSNSTAEEPAPRSPSTEDSNSDSSNETKHGGLLDLLKRIFP